MALLGWLLVGLIAGAVARWLLPGPDPMGLGGTLALGLVGSVVGGFLANLFGSGSVFSLRTTGVIGSVIGALVVLVIYRRVRADGS